jgi:hypothetical protein
MTTIELVKDITYSNNIGVAINGNYMYIATLANAANAISRLNLTDSSFVSNWATSAQGLNSPCGIAISNGNLYSVGIVTSPTINRISLTSPTTDFDANWRTTTLGTTYYGICCTAVDNYLYVGFRSGDATTGVISKISLTNPAGDYTPNWATISNGGVNAMTSLNGYLYVSVHNIGIYTVKISSPASITLFTNVVGPAEQIYGLAIQGSYLYASCHQANKLSRISLLSPSTNYTVNYANIPDTTIASQIAGIGIYNGYVYNASYSISRIGRVPITSISKITTIAGVITNTTSTTDISGLQFNTSTFFNKPVAYIENTKNGHIIFSTFTDTPSVSGGLYIVSTLTNGNAYGINMTVGTIYKLASYVTSGYAPTISVSGVRSAETTYTNTKMYGQFLTFTTNANADIYVYDLPDPPNFLNSYLHCIPYSNRTNEFTGLSTTVGYVYPIYYFPNWKAAYKMVFDPSGNLLMCMCDRQKILPLCASSSQSMYGISAQKYTTGLIPDALTINSTYYISTGTITPLSVGIDQYRNIYYTTYPYTSVIVVCYSYPTTVFNRSISSQTTQIELNIGGSGTTCIDFDSSYNLYCTTYNGKLYVLSSSTVTKNIMGIPISAGYKDRTTPWDALINNVNTSTPNGSGNNVNINDSTVILGSKASIAGIPYFSVDKITGRNLYFTGSYGIRMTVDEITSAPSVITATPLTKTIQQLNNLQAMNSYAYSGGGSIIRYYYSYDGGATYSNINAGILASYSVSSAIQSPQSLTIVAENIVGYSPSVTIPLSYPTLFAPTIDAGNTKSLTSGNLTVSIMDASNSSTNGIYYLYSTDNITYGNSGVATTAGNTSYMFTIRDTGNTLIPLVANTYTLYIKASNPIGNSATTSAPVQVYTTPQTPLIDTGNTKSLTSVNLTVSIIDSSNSAINGIYYLYSTDNITYGNSGVATTTGNTKYTFTIQNTGNALIPLVANTYTLYIKASNTIGNSATTSAPVQVYTTPLASITIDASNTQSLTSGNLTVYVNDTVNSLVNGIYYLYSTDGITYGNSGAYKTGNTTIFTISNTGNAQVPLTAQTYTLYIAAANPVGNSISNPAIAVESVYVIPFTPTIDTGNTKSITSGILNVVFTDTTNTANNQVEYIYYLYDPTTENKIVYL